MTTCRRGPDCALRTPIADPAGNRTGWQPAEYDRGDALCPADRRKLLGALHEWPELYTLLDQEQLPTMAVVTRDVDICHTKAAHGPIPLRGDIDAAQRLMDWDTRCWAEFVADELNYPWRTLWEDMSRPGARLQRSCTVLYACVDVWLAMGERMYRPRSLGLHPWDGHPVDALEDDGGDDIYCHYDGAGAACRILDLHRSVQELTGLRAQMRSPLPCTACKARNVYKDPTYLHWECRSCHHTRSDRTEEAALHEPAEPAAA